MDLDMMSTRCLQYAKEYRQHQGHYRSIFLCKSGSELKDSSDLDFIHILAE
uniref:Uncharacterized protein n=1 Tax=Physcomitrium patens TaxID=3218 RepID=A0A2K1LAN2_PHYPA|nr:hypothetical protein PHYPA_001503 [Physcomitrium patens]